MESDTIVAIVTPPGEAGVGIVRVSGPLASSLPSHLFPETPGAWRSHRLRHGTVVDAGTRTPVDDALGCLMQAPHTYTGEDVFEIHCHGNPLILDHVVHLCLSAGCRAARPGEFTLRAFLNGRLDLSQAEAVLDVVRARSNAGLELALRQLAGRLTERVEPIRQDLLGTLAHIEAMVDFVEDDIPPQLDAAARQRLDTARDEIETLLIGSESGIVLREGATLAIVGAPNVGKSSIMNALLGIERSIVTPVAGTTRDTVEEVMQVRGIPFRTIDTAGITETDDVVERIGVERSRKTLEAADVVLLVLDRSRPLSAGDAMAMDAVAAATAQDDGPRIVIALNKCDLPAELDSNGSLLRLSPVAVADSSTCTPDGMDALRAALEVAALGGARHEFVVGNVRHVDALRRSAAALRCGIDGLEAGIPLDLISFDVRAATAALGEITGASVDDELLDRIFRDFCIGK